MDTLAKDTESKFVSFKGTIEKKTTNMAEKAKTNTEKLMTRTAEDFEAMAKWADKRFSAHEKWLKSHLSFCVWNFGHLGEGPITYNRAEREGGFIRNSSSIRK